MKLHLSKNHSRAMTLVDVAVVVAIVVILAALLLVALANGKRKSARLGCDNNLKQIGLAYRIWAGDNGDIYPMGISVANGGSMELVRTGNVVATFQVMSNELSTPKILLCNGDGYGPGDTSRTYATNFSALSNFNVSYFVSVDVTNDVNPRLLLSGDSNFKIGRVPVKSGLLSIWANDPVGWTATRHHGGGYLLLNDGNTPSATPSSLHNYIIQTGVATNRLAIP